MTDASKSGVLPSGAAVITSLAPTARADRAISHLLAHATPSAPDASPRLDHWLTTAVGVVPNGGALPEASWHVAPQAPPSSDELVALGDPAQSWLAADPRAICALPRLAAALPTCRILVFVESPLAALTAWVSQAEVAPAEVERQFEGWRRGADRVLDLLPALGQRLMLVSIDDQDEVAAAELAARRLSLPPKPSMASAVGPSVQPASADPLLKSLLAGWLADDSAVVLYGRLLAACELPPASSAPPGAVPAIDRATAIASLRDVWAARAELSRQATSTPPADAKPAMTLLDAARASAETRKLRHDNELLNSFLQQMQEELETRPGSRSPAGPATGAARVAFGQEQLDTPHRHVDFTIRYERGADGPVDLAGRLVEHHGRQGVLLFADGGSRLLSRWTESGDEGGRGFMLLIPGVGSSAALIDKLPAADLQWWLQVAGDVRAALQDDLPMLQSAYWYAVASGVRDQLAEAAARLHWDEAVIDVDAEGPGVRSLRLRIPRISLGDHVEGPVALSWRVAPGAAATVELARPPEAGRPWPASWPVEPHGAVAPRWTLPVGPVLDTAGKRAAWKRVSPADRRWLLALLDALPAITAQGRSADGQTIVLSAAEAAALERASQDAREHIAPPRRSWARRLLSRLRPQRKRTP